jgi:lipoate-protein ligase A
MGGIMAIATSPPAQLLTRSLAHCLPCRLIIDGPADGAWNMALDEALLQAAEADGIATLRFYQWSEPTLSLGYFQSHADRELHPASRSCPIVRRSTGGGAILHDRELTYSIVLPLSESRRFHAEHLYQAVHGSLIDTLAEFGIAASLCPTSSVPPATEPFLCFQRRSPGDVLVGQHKIAGSAQRRRRCAILQHGSILLAKSAAAAELPGIAELTGYHLSVEQFRLAWQPRLCRAVDLTDSSPLSHGRLLAAAKAIFRTKFAASQWTERR